MNKIIKYIKEILFNGSKVNSLTVVGVGPGDPSLLTLSAINAIKKSNVIFFPISNYGNKSQAAEIVKEYIKFKKKVPILFPMARKGFNPDQIWEHTAKQIIELIKKGKSVGLLCLGDISLFASSQYIVKQIKKIDPEILIENVPGISSLSAAAALSGFNLVKKGESLSILECPNNQTQLSNLIKDERNKQKVLVILKVGDRWIWVKKVLEKENIIHKSLLAINVGLENQYIDNAAKKNMEKLPYFSLLFLRF